MRCQPARRVRAREVDHPEQLIGPVRHLNTKLDIGLAQLNQSVKRES
jgi:hypothetical protein